MKIVYLLISSISVGRNCGFFLRLERCRNICHPLERFLYLVGGNWENFWHAPAGIAIENRGFPGAEKATSEIPNLPFRFCHKKKGGEE